jgi:hypothetical protein
MSILTFGIAILCGLLVLWLLGGVFLRIGGLLLVLAGGFGVGIQHDPSGILVLAVGALLWLAGYVFLCWAPDWLDPTRDWAIPIADGEAVDAGRRTS